MPMVAVAHALSEIAVHGHAKLKYPHGRRIDADNGDGTRLSYCLHRHFSTCEGASPGFQRWPCALVCGTLALTSCVNCCESFSACPAADP
jgi:hypothetical protein